MYYLVATCIPMPVSGVSLFRYAALPDILPVRNTSASYHIVTLHSGVYGGGRNS